MELDSFPEPDLQQLLERIARENCFKEPKYEIEPAGKPGDNYVGRLLRIVIREKGPAEKEPLALIMKTAPVTEARRVAFQTSRMFATEGSMYEIVLPTINSFLKKYGLSDSDTYPNTARCVGMKLVGDPKSNELDAIVVADKTPEGYQMRDRTAGLNVDEIRLVLKELARLHSASIALRHLQPEEYRRIEASIPENMFTRDTPLLDQLVLVAERSVLYTLDRYPEGSSEHIKLRKFLDRPNYTKFLLSFAQPNELTCLVHGDCWINNILFKFTEGGVVDKVCLIDFQTSRFCTPVLDLSYFIFLSSSKKVRDEHYHNFLRYYHDEVTSNLQRFGLEAEEVFSWKTLQEHLKTFGRIGLSAALFCVPAMLADPSEIPQDIDKMMNGNTNMSEVFNAISVKDREKCKTALSDILEDMVKLEYL